MKRLFIALLACFVSSFPVIAGAATYQLDTDHSSIQFKVGHLTISNVTGRFNKFQGSASVEGDDPAKRKIEVTIDAASIDTGNQKRDEHLRTAEFLDTGKYPAITFVSKKSIAGDSGKFKIIGDLTLHGITREITVDLTGMTPEIKDPWGKLRRGVTGKARIDRRDFGITWSKVLDTGGLLIGNEVDIYVAIEWVRK